MTDATQTIVFGGGCFWCTEAVFQNVRGVTSVMPGYSGGQVENPTYEQVCSGKTGHAEVLRIEYDPTQVRFQDLLKVFFSAHDPTTLNRQGDDVGTQYRSAIYYTTDTQKEEAEAYITQLAKTQPASKQVVTELKPLKTFFEADESHRQYYLKNPSQAYCQLVIAPKLDKVQQEHSELLTS